MSLSLIWVPGIISGSKGGRYLVSVQSCTAIVLSLIFHRDQTCSLWPHGLRSESAVAYLLALWFRTPPWAWMSVVSVVCCQIEVSASGWSLVQRSLLTLVHNCVWSRNLVHEELLASWGLLRHEKKDVPIYCGYVLKVHGVVGVS